MSGVKVKVTKSDTKVANTMVRPNVLKKIPAMDFMKAIGTNTQTFVSVEAIMATMISEVPL